MALQGCLLAMYLQLLAASTSINNDDNKSLMALNWINFIIVNCTYVSIKFSILIVHFVRVSNFTVSNF